MASLYLPAPPPEPGLLARIPAILRRRCPECLGGSVFRSWLSTHERCPACGARFETEPGYYTGAMYVSYALQVPIFGLSALAAWLLLPGWPYHLLFLAAWIPALPLLPLVFVYSRVIWLHLDRYAQSHDPRLDFPSALAPTARGEEAAEAGGDADSGANGNSP